MDPLQHQKPMGLPYRQDPQLEALEAFEVRMLALRRHRRRIGVAYSIGIAAYLGTGIVLLMRGYGDSGWVALGVGLAGVLLVAAFVAAMASSDGEDAETNDRAPRELAEAGASDNTTGRTRVVSGDVAHNGGSDPETLDASTSEASPLDAFLLLL